jgi:hypothetical protein
MESERSMVWRRADTAPKDGTKILGLAPSGRVAVVEWEAEFSCNDELDLVGGWNVVDDSEGWCRPQGFPLAYWTTIPAAPEGVCRGEA